MNRLSCVAAVVFVVSSLVARSSHAQPIPGGPEETPPARTTGGLGRGFTLRTEDDKTLLNFRVRTQFQGFYESKPEDPQTGAVERPDIGFMVRRMRLVFQGHVFDRDIRYYVQLGFSPRDQEPDLLIPVRDAQLVWTGIRDLSVRVGQMKVPFNRERVISSSSLGMVDRSNVNFELNLDRDIGIMLQSRDLFGLGDVLRYNAGVFGGDGRNRTTPNTGRLYAARIEVAPFGAFEDYSSVDFARSRKPRVSLGFAAAYSESTVRVRSTFGDTLRAGTLDYRHGAADLIFKWRGLSVQSEVLFRRASQTVLTKTLDDGTVLVERPRNGLGYMVQAGLMLDEHWEPSLRYGEVRPLDDGNPAFLRDREIGGGLGYYFHRHDLKIQSDYFRVLTDADSSGDVVLGRDRVRVQAQFYF